MSEGDRRIRTKDWSINLEDSYYAEHPEELILAAVGAIKETAEGVYVNLVTPGELGMPEDTFLPDLVRQLEERSIAFRQIQYIDECGCGGYVTRVHV